METPAAAKSRQLISFLAWSVACGVVSSAGLAIARSEFGVSTDEFSALGGVLASVLNILIISLLSSVLFRGSADFVALSLLLTAKLTAFLVLVVILSVLPTSSLWAFLAGFFCFVPGGLIVALLDLRSADSGEA